jgi:hypothetical protein
LFFSLLIVPVNKHKCMKIYLILQRTMIADVDFGEFDFPLAHMRACACICTRMHAHFRVAENNFWWRMIRGIRTTVRVGDDSALNVSRISKENVEDFRILFSKRTFLRWEFLF